MIPFALFLIPMIGGEPALRDRAWETSLAERMAGTPNPYGHLPRVLETPHLRFEVAALPEPPRERRYFEMEDSADWLGIQLGRRVVLGLQVEMAGPAEEPKQSRLMTNLRWDPFAPVYVQTTAGIRIPF